MRAGCWRVTWLKQRRPAIANIIYADGEGNASRWPDGERRFWQAASNPQRPGRNTCRQTSWLMPRAKSALLSPASALPGSRQAGWWHAVSRRRDGGRSRLPAGWKTKEKCASPLPLFDKVCDSTRYWCGITTQTNPAVLNIHPPQRGTSAADHFREDPKLKRAIGFVNLEHRAGQRPHWAVVQQRGAATSVYRAESGIKQSALRVIGSSRPAR